jgi:hypothetical protein
MQLFGEQNQVVILAGCVVMGTVRPNIREVRKRFFFKKKEPANFCFSAASAANSRSE